MRAIHNLSKEARFDIILLLLEKRSKKELAAELGITPAAVAKFVSKLTHPSDETLERAIQIADNDERKRIVKIIIHDLINGLKEAIENYGDYVDDEEIEEIKEIIVDYLEGKRELLSLRLV
ncbi:MAG: helix-turn-helix domain-containing protein [Sulfolobus sp.]|nr:helix-turn-helix domain-containing protein [Sulfolobus sp.]